MKLIILLIAAAAALACCEAYDEYDIDTIKGMVQHYMHNKIGQKIYGLREMINELDQGGDFDTRTILLLGYLVDRHRLVLEAKTRNVLNLLDMYSQSDNTMSWNELYEEYGPEKDETVVINVNIYEDLRDQLDIPDSFREKLDKSYKYMEHLLTVLDDEY